MDRRSVRGYPAQETPNTRRPTTTGRASRTQNRSSTPPGGRPLRTTLRIPPEFDDSHRKSNKDRVVTVVLPGTEDPAKILRSGDFTLSWKSNGTVHQVTKFMERPVRHIVDASLTLPTLYLHFLAPDFFAEDQECDPTLRAGNDNAEMRIVLPRIYANADEDLGLRGEIKEHLSIVLSFLREQGEVQITTIKGERQYTASSCPDRLAFSLHTARPKSPISLPKQRFGIPMTADLYLFVFNHASVQYMSEEERLAFEVCIEQLPSHGTSFKELSIFLKVFYEGAFGYNMKDMTSGSRYVPKNVGIGCMSVTPAFDGQGGIATGYPYLVEPRILSFADSIPVTIRTISRMSDRHQRYGLCFTRCVHIWAGEAFDQSGALEFCSILPNGGFFYLPGSLAAYRRLGGLIYSFGEDRLALERPAQLHDVSTAHSAPRTSTSSSSPSSPTSGREERDRICVICLDADAVMATLPCGHLSYCQSCVELARSRECPVCRAAVQSIVRIF